MSDDAKATREDQELELRREELALKREDLALKGREVAAKELEAQLKVKDQRFARWLNPLFIGLVLASLSIGGNILVTILQGRTSATQEDTRSQNTLIVEAIRTGDQDKAASNLDFFLKLGFIKDPEGKIAKYLADKSNVAPVLPASAGVPPISRTPPKMKADSGQIMPLQATLQTTPKALADKIDKVIAGYLVTYQKGYDEGIQEVKREHDAKVEMEIKTYHATPAEAEQRARNTGSAAMLDAEMPIRLGKGAALAAYRDQINEIVITPDDIVPFRTKDVVAAKQEIVAQCDNNGPPQEGCSSALSRLSNILRTSKQ